MKIVESNLIWTWNAVSTAFEESILILFNLRDFLNEVASLIDIDRQYASECLAMTRVTFIQELVDDAGSLKLRNDPFGP